MKRIKASGKFNSRFLVVCVTALIVVIADQITKYFVRVYSPDVSVIGDFLRITFTENLGAGFGILQGKTMILVFISVMVIGAIFYYLDKVPQKMQVFVGLILGGTIGNLIDRLAFGSVTDMINFSFWPNFNIADAALTVGVIVLVVWYWRE